MTLVIAHRGSSWDLPENSLPAFERAVEDGADYVEFDVRVGPRKALVCGHDPPTRDADCLTLDAVLEAVGRRIGLAIDLKTESAASPTLAALEAYGIPDEELMVVSFRRSALAIVAEQRPGIRRAFHLGGSRKAEEARGFWGVGMRLEQARPGLLARAEELGLHSLVYTVNDPHDMRALSARGVAGIFTDRPKLLRETLRAAPA